MPKFLRKEKRTLPTGFEVASPQLIPEGIVSPSEGASGSR